MKLTCEQIIEALTNMPKDEFAKVFGVVCSVAIVKCCTCSYNSCDNCDTSCSHCPCDDCSLNVIK